MTHQPVTPREQNYQCRTLAHRVELLLILTSLVGVLPALGSFLSASFLQGMGFVMLSFLCFRMSKFVQLIVELIRRLDELERPAMGTTPGTVVPAVDSMPQGIR